MWQGLARLFGHDLKSEYDAAGRMPPLSTSSTPTALSTLPWPGNRRGCPLTEALHGKDHFRRSTPYLCAAMEKAFILYDLEATCWRTSRPKRVEIIEVGAVKGQRRP